MLFEKGSELGYEPNSIIAMSLATMTKAVNVFKDFFNIIFIGLCLCAFFILANYGIKLIRDRKYEIGILKALGTREKDLTTIFGMQILIEVILIIIMYVLGSILFIDFEMNMQDYVAINGFEPEIIEAGLVITNGDGAVYDIKHWYIKPTKFKTITRRTMKFLHYTKAELNQAVDFKVFYNELKALVEKYNPYVVVWGKSDITQLKKTCEINKCPELKLHFVNLLQLHTNYDNLKDSPGLFSMWETYNGTKLPEQTHDSLEDATVTKEVFFNFKDKILK